MKSIVQLRTVCHIALGIVFFLSLPLFSYSQTFFDISSTPTDNSAQAGPTAAVTPPVSMIAGDLVIIYAQYRAISATISMSATGGQTWNTAATNTGTNQTYSIFWCEYNGTWGANPSVTVGAGANGLTAVMYVYRPSNSNNSWALHIGPTYSSTTATAQSITGITTTAPNTVTMGFWASGTATTWGAVSGAGWVKPTFPVSQTQIRNTTGGQSHTAAYNINTAPATIANASQTQSSNVLCFKTIISWHEVNDVCIAAPLLNSNTVCTLTPGTLQNSTVSSPAVATACGTAGGDVWYSFIAQTATPTITLSNLGANLTGNARIQLLSGSCGSLSPLSCVSGNSLAASGLTPGTTYYIRVYSNNLTPTGSAWDFDICITDPGNDLCSAAPLLTSSTTCSKYYSSLNSATYTATTGMTSSCGTLTSQDVWFKFVAATAYPVITVGDLGTNWGSLLRISLFSGNCSGVSEVACANNAPLDTRTTPGGSGLTVGNTYYVRVYKSNATAPGASNWQFSICITDPVAGKYDYSKSYVNLSKKTTGGTVDPGDSLEIRATFVIFSGNADSLSFTDTLYKNRGFTFGGIADSISTRTNEGKNYKFYTDNAADADAGYRLSFGANPDTAIRINFGTSASSTARGELRNTSKPSVFGGTCIIMSTYRVKVNAAYNTKIRFGGGAITYRDSATGIFYTVNFKNDSLIVYQSPGLCPNSVSVTNAVGVETNGTFGAPSTGAPLARNRGTSSYVPGYIYSPFDVVGGPNDYYYGIANNTSANFSFLQNWYKADTASSPSYRVFGHWDIMGDHTGAVNSGKGNPPCDTTQPVSSTNPCGYMLVINSSYKTDTAFQYTVSNLCPNTYYEISAWVKNICYKCACDSNGHSALLSLQSPAYVPSAPGDSSGVQPNLAFDINGTDYYTTGNLRYIGTTPTKSDTSNRWVKRGFTYLTGASQTSFTLTVRNNAPGGGGNDWAMDDITVATCLPDMKYSPTLNPAVCYLNIITLRDTVRSYFNNYTQYKWQRSTDAGVTWADISGANGTGTPVYTGGVYQYIASYTVPFVNTQMANNGDRYRLVVATTIANLSNVNCNITDGQIINLNVIYCMPALAVHLLSFNGKLQNDHANLFWTTSREDEAVTYTIEKSTDGTNFTGIGTVEGYFNNAEINRYSFIDPSPAAKTNWYRLNITNIKGGKKCSNIIYLTKDQNDFTLSNVINPFHNELAFNVSLNNKTTNEARLIDIVGNVIKTKSFLAYSGTNSLSMETSSLTPGIYTLQLQYKESTLSRKVIKR